MHPYKLGGWNEETVQVFFGIIRCLLSLKEIFCDVNDKKKYTSYIFYRLYNDTDNFNIICVVVNNSHHNNRNLHYNISNIRICKTVMRPQPQFKTLVLTLIITPPYIYLLVQYKWYKILSSVEPSRKLLWASSHPLVIQWKTCSSFCFLRNFSINLHKRYMQHWALDLPGTKPNWFSKM